MTLSYIMSMPNDYEDEVKIDNILGYLYHQDTKHWNNLLSGESLKKKAYPCTL